MLRNNVFYLVPSDTPEKRFWFWLVIIYMLIDLAQVHLIVRPLSVIRPGMLTIILLALYILTNWKNIVRDRLSDQAKLTVLFVFLLFVFVPFSRNNYWAYKAALSMLLMLPFLVSINALVDCKRKLLRFVFVIEVCLFVLSIYSLSHRGVGPGGIMADENDFTLFVVVALPFVFLIYSQTEHVYMKLFSVMVVVVALLAIVNAFSRGGFIGLVCMLATYWIFSKNKILSILIIGALFWVLYLSGGDKYFNEMKTVTDPTESTASQRLLSWEAGWNMFLDNPLGVGGNNFPIHFPDYQPDELRQNMWGRAAHSLWFTLIPELGIFGIVIYGTIVAINIKNILLMTISIKKCQRSVEEMTFYSELGKTFAASFAGFFATATFISVLYYPHFWYLSLLLGSSVYVLNKEKKNCLTFAGLEN